MFGLGATEIVILLFIALLLFLWIYAVIHCIRNQSLSPTLKVVWLLAIIFLHPFGAIIYLIVANMRQFA